MSGELACMMAGLGEGTGSRSSRPYSSPLEGAAVFGGVLWGGGTVAGVWGEQQRGHAHEGQTLPRR